MVAKTLSPPPYILLTNVIYLTKKQPKHTINKLEIDLTDSFFPFVFKYLYRNSPN